MRRVFLLTFLIHLSIFSYVPAYSLTLRLDNSELVTRSSVVVYGTVKEIHSKGHNKEAIVLIECVLKGKLPAAMDVRVIFSHGMEDSPLFEVNECVLLFLTRSNSELFQTVGGLQGKFSFGKRVPDK